jgi:hypothetical protein
MRARLFMTAIAGLSLATASSAEPAKAPVRKADQAVEKPAPIVVASAEEATVPPSTQQDSPPAKPVRHARVTSCRCGDQNPSD